MSCRRWFQKPARSARRVRYPKSVEVLESRCLLAGELDPTFGQGGLVTTDLHRDLDRGSAVALQRDGKIVLAGTTDIGFGSADVAIGLIRYNPDGSRDNSFGVSGAVTTDLSTPPRDDIPADIVIQADGKIVVVGGAGHADGHFQFAIARYNPDGTLDSGFGSGGLVLENLGTEDRAVAVDLQNGKIVVLGYEVDSFGTSSLLLARFNTDGSLDPTFGNIGATPGVVRFDLGSTSVPSDLAVGSIAPGSPNYIVVAGTRGQQAVLARFDPNGTRDSNFGSGQHAVAVTSFGGSFATAGQILIQPDYTMLFAGDVFTGPDTSVDFAVARFLVDGTADQGFRGRPLDIGYSVVDFGSTGVSIRIDELSGMALQLDGSIVLVGETFIGDDSNPDPDVDFALARILPHGALDTSFGIGGLVRTNFGPGVTVDAAGAVVLQPDDGIVVAGESNGDFAVARYLGDSGLPRAADSDRDGVLNLVEDAHPVKVPGTDFGDGNGDGIPDSQQATVTSFLSEPGSGEYITLSVVRGHFENVRSVAQPSVFLSDIDRPLGTVAFDVLTGGNNVLIEVRRLPGVAMDSLDSFFAFGPTADDPLNHWYKIPATVEDDMNPLRSGERFLSFQLINGGIGDNDRVRNTRIVTVGSPADDLATDVRFFGRKFHDVDGDGIDDGPFFGEVALAGWTIYLDENQNGQLDRDPATGQVVEPFDVTNSNGVYGFSGLERRTYTVAELPRPGWVNTAPGPFAHQVIDLASTPRSVMARDMNGDGLEDLVAVVNPHDEVRIFMNAGDGRFTPRDPLPVGGSPEAVAIADFNQDTLLDIAVTRTSGGDVSILLAAANGMFSDPVRVSVGDEPYGIVTADLNRDAIADLVTANFVSDDITVLLGNGDGTFETARTFAAVNGDGPVALVFGHFSPTFDGNLDLAVANANSDTVSIFLGTGTGDFTWLESVPLGGDLGVHAGALATGKFNPTQDDFIDLAVALSGSDSVVILLGTGNGVRPGTSLAVGDRPTSVRAIALGTSVIHNLVVSNEDGSSLTLIEGNGDGTLRYHLEHAVPEQPFQVTAGNFDRNGDADLAVANRRAGSLSVLLANPSASQKVRLGNDPLSSDGIDFGNRSLFDGLIRGEVWLDESGDGVRDSLEPGIAGQIVFLDQNLDGRWDFPLEPSTLTNARGEYELHNLPPGVYRVRHNPPAQFALTSPEPGFWELSLQADEVRSGENFGVQPPAQIRGVSWEDVDGDGVRDPDEPGLAGWTIFADLNENGVHDLTGDLAEPSASTDASGRYSLMLVGGTYTVREVGQANWVQSHPGAAGHPPITVAQGQVFANVNFGNQFFPGEIRGVVWHDENGNGVRDDVGNDGFFDEPGQFGVTVYLDLNENGQRDADEPSRVTDFAGNYVFASLSSGRTYVVAEEIPASLAQSFPGFDTGRVHRVSLGTAQMSAADFGNTAESIIVGTKFQDTNGDGQPGNLEPRLTGTFFVDLNRNSRPDPGEPASVTDHAGEYLIRGLPPGTYTVMDQSETVTLRDPHFQVGRDFGFSLAASGSWIVVGDPKALRADVLNLPAELGRVYIFARDDYQLVRELIHPNPNSDPQAPLDPSERIDAFGFSVAVARDWVVVGSPFAPSFPHVFLFDAVTGRDLFPGRTGEETHFQSIISTEFEGTSVAVLEPYAVVGSPSDTESPGRVGLYPLAPGAIAEVLWGPGPQAPHGFGEAVAVLGNHLVIVGSPTEDTIATDSGAVHLFDPLREVLLRTFHHPTGQPFANFGVSVAGLGTDVLIGAPADDRGGDEAGAAFLFDARLFDTTNPPRTFLNPDPASGDRFGFSVAALRDKILIGAPGDDTQGVDAGAAYLFDAGTGELLLSLFSPNPLAGAQFGFAVAAVDDTHIVIGAPSPSLSSDPGAAYILELPLRVTIATPGQIESLNFPSGQAAEPEEPVEPQGAIRGSVWNDLDGDGRRDPGEPGLAGRIVFLDDNGNSRLDPSDLAERTALTNEQGDYEFPRLWPGSYSVAEVIPSGWTPTFPRGTTAAGYSFGTSFPVAEDPCQLTTADLNEDGLVDLAITDFSSGNVSVLLNRPDAPGTFDPPQLYPVNPRVNFIVSGDFNGDGSPDLAMSVANDAIFGDTNLMPLLLLFNDPTVPGSFLLPAVTIPEVGFQLHSLTVADWNQDGLSDLALVANEKPVVLLNNRDAPGTFSARSYDVRIDLVGSTIEVLTAGDFNGDGLVDFAVGNQDGLSVFVNNPMVPGMFLPPDTYVTADPVFTLSSGDINGDGLADLVAHEERIHVRLNDASNPGRFRQPNLYEFPGGPLDMALVDLNLDGFTDVVAATLLSDLDRTVLAVLLNDASALGTLLPVSRYAVGPAGPKTVKSLAVADIDLDGFPDPMVAIDPDGVSVAARTTIHLVRQQISVNVGQRVAGIDFGNHEDVEMDGVSNAVEDQAPGGDGNNDLIPDSQQANVVSLPSADGSYVTLVAPPGIRFVDVRVLESLPVGAPPAAFPLGLFDFTLDGVAAGGLVDVEFILHDNPNVNAYFKFGHTPDDPPFTPPHWYDFSFEMSTMTGARFPRTGNRLVVSFVDNGRGDDDPTPGRIRDPGGPAILSAGSIRGQAFHDLDRDGEHDDSDPGLEGWTIQLLGELGNLVATTQTQPTETVVVTVPREIVQCTGRGRRRHCTTETITEDVEQIVTQAGFYRFTDLPPGNFTVAAVSQPGWSQSFPGPGSAHTVIVENGQAVHGIDFGSIHLGGNVTAQVVRGRLLIRGDDAPNRFHIARAGDLSYLITPVVGTLVNGRFQPAVFSDARRGIRIDTGDGDDAVLFREPIGPSSPVMIRGELSIRTRSSNDTVWLDLVTVRGPTRVVTGPGSDQIELIDSLLEGGLTLAGGRDSDTIRLRRTRVQGNASLLTTRFDSVEVIQ
jgi:uncharacterized delta-60 repeat protein